MEKYQVKIKIEGGASAGAIVIVEIVAKSEASAKYRALSLLKETDCGIVEIITCNQ